MLTVFYQLQGSSHHFTKLRPKHKPFTIRLTVLSRVSQSQGYDQLAQAVPYSHLRFFAALQGVILPLQMGCAILHMDHGVGTSEILE